MNYFLRLVLALALVTGGITVPLALNKNSDVAADKTSVIAAPLDQRVAIYVPSTVDVTASAEPLGEKLADEALVRFSNLFGGASAQAATGAFVSKQGLVKERIQIVYSF